MWNIILDSNTSAQELHLLPYRWPRTLPGRFLVTVLRELQTLGGG